MALTVRVLDEKDLAGADPALLAVARGDLNARVEVDDVLAPWRGMPVEIVIGLDLAEDDAGGGDPLREPPGAGRLRVLDLDVLEMRLAILVRVEPVDLHGGLLLESRTVVPGVADYTSPDGHEARGRPRRGGRAAPRDARDGPTARARGGYRALLSEPRRRAGALRGAGALDEGYPVLDQHREHLHAPPLRVRADRGGHPPAVEREGQGPGRR